VGGAVIGNAGAFGGYVGDNLRAALVLVPGEEERWWPSDELGLGYRTSVFKERLKDQPFSPVVISAVFALRKEAPDRIQERAAEYQLRRAQSQPQGLSAGSVFKRTEQYPAGFLIENAGLKGKRVGGAVVSPKHANFIVNLGTATACDVRDLIDHIRDAVAREFGITLDLEIELVGDW
jgi:UDP-N-acetylmuramate dehydrogenase